MATAKTYTLTERTLLTADGQAVPAGHPDGVALLGAAGRTIPWAEAVACGLAADTSSDYPQHVGGGWYELSDGSRVKGKDDAAAAQKLLHDDTDDKALEAGEDK